MAEQNQPRHTVRLYAAAAANEAIHYLGWASLTVLVTTALHTWGIVKLPNNAGMRIMVLTWICAIPALLSALASNTAIARAVANTLAVPRAHYQKALIWARIPVVVSFLALALVLWRDIFYWMTRHAAMTSVVAVFIAIGVAALAFTASRREREQG